jgi:hypothetical protein
MEYTKPVIVAENNKNGSFAAGCPSQGTCPTGSTFGDRGCKACDRAQ